MIRTEVPPDGLVVELLFRVVDKRQAARFARDFNHCVIDTEAGPDEEDLKVLAEECDLLIIPTSPDIPCTLVPRVRASLLTDGLRRSARPVRRFASARSDTYTPEWVLQSTR